MVIHKRNNLWRNNKYDVSALIDNKKKEIDRLRPFAIKYMIEHKRLQGSKWYDDLANKVLGSEQEWTKE